MKKVYIILLLLISAQVTFSQGNVGVGTATPDSSAVLDVNSTSKGMLIPRMTTAQRDSIVTPAVGLQIFNLDDMCLDMFDGYGWIKNCGLRYSGTNTVESAWIERPVCGGGGRYEAVGFSIGSKGYIGTGLINGVNKKDFWEYDPGGKTWSQKADFDGSARNGAIGFSIGDKGYVGLGNNSTVYEIDFYQFDPDSNNWERLDDFDGPGRARAVGFSINRKGYMGTGSDGSDYMDFWEYDPSNDSWDEKDPLPGGPRYRAVGISLNGKGYVGTGRAGPVGDEMRDFWEYDPITEQWLPIDSLPEGRLGAIGFSIYNKMYVGLGLAPSNQYPPTFWQYNPVTYEWTTELEFPGVGRMRGVAFSIGNKGFVGTGYVGGPLLNDFWEFSPGATLSNYENASIIESTYGYHDGIWKREFDDVHLAAFGNLGLGTSKPMVKLEVVGDIIQRNGNVGFGNTSPHAPLHFNNSNDNRKLVFNEVMDNDHQFYGFGNGPSTLQYQVGDTTGAHVFYAGTTAPGSTELMRITGKGKVGIGVSTPNEYFEVGKDGRAFFGNGGGNTRRGLLIDGLETGAARIEAYDYTPPGAGRNLLINTTGHGFVGIDIESPAQKLHVHGNAVISAKLGIGITTPNAPLQFTTTTGNRKIVLYEEQNNNHMFYGFGINGGILRYQVPAGTNHVFYAGVDSTNSIELMRIKANGNVGIGTASPTQKLHVAGNIIATGNLDLVGTISNEIGPTLTLLNGFFNLLVDYAPCAYYKDKEKRVHITGTVDRNGIPPDDTLIFTLNDGYKPAATVRYLVPDGPGSCQIEVDSNGGVRVFQSVNGIISLDGISFRTN